MEKPLEVCIAAGGTAGHINPALALAEELTDRGHHVRFVGQPTRLEAELVPAVLISFQSRSRASTAGSPGRS